MIFLAVAVVSSLNDCRMTKSDFYARFTMTIAACYIIFMAFKEFYGFSPLVPINLR